jgi:predicted exporter
MTKVTITPENPGDLNGSFRAAARGRESMGPTAGAALDALGEQLNEEERNTLIIVQSMRPDEYFPAHQRQRLTELLAKRRAAMDAGGQMDSLESAELESLIDAELEGATRRAAAMVGELRS